LRGKGTRVWWVLCSQSKTVPADFYYSESKGGKKGALYYRLKKGETVAPGKEARKKKTKNKLRPAQKQGPRQVRVAQKTELGGRAKLGRKEFILEGGRLKSSGENQKDKIHWLQQGGRKEPKTIKGHPVGTVGGGEIVQEGRKTANTSGGGGGRKRKKHPNNRFEGEEGA